MAYSKSRPHVCITEQAHRHLKKMVSAKKRQGLVENNTKLLSELILSQPIPSGPHPIVGSAEVRVINKEAQQ